MTIVLIPAFLLGLLGSAHCLGMCGPIALAIPVGNRNTAGRIIGVSLYAAGRLATYVLFGILFGLVGRGLGLLGIQQFISITLGVMMIAAVILPRTDLFERLSRAGGRSFLQWTSGLRGLYARRDNLALLAMGGLNGALPCGMVYLALAGAISLNGPVNGGLFMAAFGSGTLPVMWTLHWAGSRPSGLVRQRVVRWLPYLYVAMGTLLIFRGLGLGIPFLSPDLIAVPLPAEACP